MRIWQNSISFVHESSGKMSKIDILALLRSVFYQFNENILLEWFPRMFPEKRHLVFAFNKNIVISDLYLIFSVEP